MRLRFLFPLILFAFFGCATTEETTELKFKIEELDQEIQLLKEDSSRKILKTEEKIQTALKKEFEQVRGRIAELSLLEQNHEEKLRQISGKIEEIGFEIESYRRDFEAYRKSIENLIARLDQRIKILETKIERPKEEKKDYESLYREAFQAFENERYEESIEKFSQFLKDFSQTPLSPKALFFLGESYMKKGDFERAIVSYQEFIEKYPNDEKVAPAMFSQAEAFLSLKDKKSAIALFKKLIELHPESREAKLAKARLRALE